MPQQGGPGGGEGEVPAGTVDEPHADARLQLGEGAGQGGLGHVQPGRRRGHGARLGHGVQRTEVAKLHIIHARQA